MLEYETGHCWNQILDLITSLSSAFLTLSLFHRTFTETLHILGRERNRLLFSYIHMLKVIVYKSYCEHNMHILGRFIYILDSSNSSSITFWTTQFSSSSRGNWTGIWTSNSNGSWTVELINKQLSHFSTAKEWSVKATFFFINNHKLLKLCWNEAEILLN